MTEASDHHKQPRDYRVCIITYSNFLIHGQLNLYNRILKEVYDNDHAAREWTKGMSSLSADEIVNYSTEIELSPIENT